MGRMSKGVSQLAALSLLIAVLAVLMLGVALPITQRFQELAQALEDQRRQLGEFRGFSGQDQAIAGIEEQYRAALAMGEFLSGDTELDRRSNLQGVLSGLAEEARVRIISARPLPDRERGRFKLLGMSLNFTADIQSVQTLLYAIETTRPYLLIEAADFSPLGGGGSKLVGPRLLEVRLAVFAVPYQGGQP